MSGGGFSVGASPAPANTGFFGALPDKFTMLFPGHMSGSGPQIDSVVLTPAQMQLISNWTIYNTSFTGGSNAATLTLGSSATAPDGSSNAIHLSETTTNSSHAMLALSPTSPPGAQGGAIYRLGVFAKAAERTRIALQLASYNNSTLTGAVTTVFDLSGGQVGVAGTASGGASPAWVPIKDTIKAWPNGWYQCEIDVNVGQFVNSPQAIMGNVLIDSGSGVGAASTSYTGTGGSGVYVWRGTMLPPAAWGMGYNTLFFDDFTSLSTIDTSNTQASGFNWYIHNSWNEGSQLGFTDGNLGDSNPAAMSISNSVLTINPTPGPTDGSYGTNIIMSAVFLGTPATYTPPPQNYNLGFLWRPPALLEFNCSFNMNIALSGPTHNWANWAVSIETLTKGHQSPAPYGADGGYIEIDFGEWIPGGGRTTDIHSNLVDPNINTALGVGILSGSPIYYSNLKYGVNSIVFYQGALYQRNGTSQGTINGQVPTNATYWNSFSPTYGANSIAGVDVTQMNLYQALWLPRNSTDVSHIVLFLNGLFASEMTFSNSGPLNSTWSNGDFRQYPIFLQTSSGDVSTASWDYVKVSR